MRCISVNRALVEFEVKCCVVISAFGLLRWQPSLEEKQEATAARNNIHSFSFIATPTLGPRSLWAKVCSHPGRVVAGPCRKANKHSDSHSHLQTIPNLPLASLFLDRGRELKYPERTHADTGGTRKLQTERARARGSNPRLQEPDISSLKKTN